MNHSPLLMIFYKSLESFLQGLKDSANSDIHWLSDVGSERG